MKDTITVEEVVDKLASFPAFAEVDREAVSWLVENSSCEMLPVGEYLFRSGDPIENMWLITDGQYIIRLERDGRKREVGTYGPGTVSGQLPFSRMKEVTADAQVLEELHYLEFHRDGFVEMVNRSYELTQALVGVMMDRVRDFQVIRLMDEKLLALGKMSAGLAHELNNPASAIVRSSNELYQKMRLTPDRFKEVITMRVTLEQTDQVNALLFETLADYDKTDLSILEREELTDDIEDWLDDHEIDEAADLADTFVDFCFGIERLERVKKILPIEALGPVLRWIEMNFQNERLVNEIKTASERIGTLVKSIKSYSHMDEEPSLEWINVHQGLKSTITMIAFRFKKGNIGLEKDLDYDLPKIKALPGELNQVWTNLLVNALDAMPEENGVLKLRSFRERDCVCVEIEDNGAGIPEDIQSRIFEPFFTTKGIGEGTGMGLDIVRRVIERHHGYISVESVPGRTCFKVCFPIEQ